MVPAIHQELVIMKKYSCGIFGKESFDQITEPKVYFFMVTKGIVI
jgi:hypothetical protein